MYPPLFALCPALLTIHPDSGRKSRGGGTRLSQDGELGHEKNIFHGMWVTEKASVSEPKIILLLFSCVILGKSLGISEQQLAVVVV